jgi:hypothetical protein
MSLIIFILIFCFFISYYKLSSGGHWIYFALIGLALRLLIPIPSVLDYAAYYTNNIYDYNFYGIADIISEPAIKLIYNIAFVFFNDKKQTVHFIYWLNFSTCMYLFYRISQYRIPYFKKMILFSFYFFLFSYILLRNGIPYLLVFMFFYELNNTESKLRKLIVASFFHATAAIVLFVQLLFEIKIERLIVYGISILAILALLAINNIFVFDYFIDKFVVYAEVERERSNSHIIWMLFIFSVFFWSFIENRVKSSTVFFITFMTIYIILNYINPVMGFRLSLYIFLFYLTLPITNPKIAKYVPDVNLLSFGLFFLFYLNYSNAHY